MKKLPKTKCWDGHDIDNEIQKYTVMPCAIRALTETAQHYCTLNNKSTIDELTVFGEREEQQKPCSVALQCTAQLSQRFSASFLFNNI